MFPNLFQVIVGGLALFNFSYAARSTVTVRIATGTCPAIPSQTVLEFSTTNAAGSYILCSSTESLFESLYTFTSTNAAGSTELVIGSTLVPEPLGSLETSTYGYFTTNSAGSLYVATGVTTFTVGSAKSSAPIHPYTTTNTAGITVVTTGAITPSASMQTYTTTNSAGRTITTTGTITPTASTHMYTTTDSAGNTIVTSGAGSTSVSIVTYSTTDSAGDTVLTSGTIVNSVTTSATTNSAGSTVQTTSTSAISTSSALTSSSSVTGGTIGVSSETSTTPSTPTTSTIGTTTSTSMTSATAPTSPNSVGVTTQTSSESSTTAMSSTTSIGATTSEADYPMATGRTPCPAPLAQPYTSLDKVPWQLVCNSEVYYDDLPATNTSSLEDCIASCDRYVPLAYDPIYGGQPCVAVTFTDQIISGANCYRKFDVKQVIYGTSPFDSAKLTSFGLSPALSVSVVNLQINTQTTGTATIVANASSTLSSAVATFTTYEPVTPCPITNNTYYTSPDKSGIIYFLQCGITYFSNSLPGVVTDSFEHCIDACDSWNPGVSGNSFDEPCIGVTYTNYDPSNPAFQNCYRHYAIAGSRFDGNPYGNGAVRVAGIPSSSSSSTRTSTTSTSRSISATMVGSSTRAGSSSSRVTSTSSTSTTHGTSASSSISSVPQKTGVPCPCPPNNGDTLTDGLGHVYRVYCNQTIQLAPEPGSYYAPNLDNCLQSCDNFSGDEPCAGVRYAHLTGPEGFNCFRMKANYTTSAVSSQSSVCAAILQS
ncbi:hypothetical protein MMC10_008680 [Thelotrema lepadinum]|nr:hypothetical protein [Thelotrema lepadinum]